MLSTNGVSTVPPSTVSQQAFTTPGSFTWTCPAGVTSVCVVAVGPGGKRTTRAGCPGGGLGWKNNIPVTPGSTYTVQVGNATTGTDSFFISAATVAGKAPVLDSATGGTFVGDGGGNGGNGGTAGNGGGGGGAGGYAGNGGNGGASNSPNGTAGGAGTAGAGAGGGGAFNSSASGQIFRPASGGGGGVGLLGQGSNGTGGTGGAFGDSTGKGGTGGSSGTGGAAGALSGSGSTDGPGGVAGQYGGGGGGGGFYDDGTNTFNGANGASQNGAVRLIWGAGRSFPSTNTGDM